MSGSPPVPPTARPVTERVAALLGAAPSPGPAAGTPAPRAAWAEALADRVPPRWRVGVDRRVVAAVAVLALVAVALATAGWWRARPQSVAAPAPASGVPVAGIGEGAPAATGPADKPSGSPPTPSPAASITVHVAGRVERPGVVVLPGDARVADALRAAGGALPAADLSTLNLARPLADGEQVPVGVPGAPPAPAPPVRAGAGAGATGAPGAPAVLDLNTATAAQLEQLPGVGPVLAGQIVDRRAELGRFSSVEQLRGVRGIGERRFADLAPRVRV